ncbi:hypothetical protein JEQ12_006837 [Ovis aries]|uniref:Uncharacterized protein n=1 Tax=Ovis aries TaxID=9940 RepID=A0A836CU52_SHEEP|nr:hypothetical protein JEQ12_006837 [Ovis aries]
MEKRAISFRSFEHKTSCTSVTSASGFKPQKLQEHQRASETGSREFLQIEKKLVAIDAYYALISDWYCGNDTRKYIHSSKSSVRSTLHREKLRVNAPFCKIV